MTGKPKAFRFWQEIAMTLAIKVIILAIIWAAWFSSPENMGLDDRKVASQVLSQQTQKVLNHDANPRAR
jgi:predicted negative regulator of RcsB-dependent stress response